MSKRLQVLLDEAELDGVREAARRDGMSVSDWVRQAIREARRRRSPKGAESKLRALRAAMQHEFPAPDIEQMLSEIERGYAGLSDE